MKLIFAVLLSVAFSNNLHAFVVTGPGPAPDGTAIAEYDPATGEITVSVTNIVNWFVESSSSSLTGPDDAAPALPQAGGLVGDNDIRIGETVLGIPMIYTDINLGQVAQSGLPVGDLNIFWNPSFGVGPFSQPVVYLGQPVPEPASLVLAAFGLLGMFYFRRHRI